MTPEKSARIKELRRKLAGLNPEQRQALIDRGIIATVEGRQLSLHNTLMVYIQCNGNAPSVVGGFNQWRKAGRSVKRGEHGYTIFFPVGNKNEDGEIVEAQRFYTATVFDIKQTEIIGESQPEPKPEIISNPAPVERPQPVYTGEPEYMKGWAIV